MNTNPDTYNRNDLARLNRAADHLWEAQQAVNAERDKLAHYKLTGKLAKLAERLHRARSDLHEITAGLRDELED